MLFCCYGSLSLQIGIVIENGGSVGVLYGRGRVIAAMAAVLFRRNKVIVRIGIVQGHWCIGMRCCGKFRRHKEGQRGNIVDKVKRKDNQTALTNSHAL